MAAKFKCRLCNETFNDFRLGIFARKYICPKHKDICDRHVRSGFFGGGNPKCEACGKVIIEYEYDGRAGRWRRA